MKYLIVRSLIYEIIERIPRPLRVASGSCVRLIDINKPNGYLQSMVPLSRDNRYNENLIIAAIVLPIVISAGITFSVYPFNRIVILRRSVSLNRISPQVIPVTSGTSMLNEIPFTRGQALKGECD